MKTLYWWSAEENQISFNLSSDYVELKQKKILVQAAVNAYLEQIIILDSYWKSRIKIPKYID